MSLKTKVLELLQVGEQNERNFIDNLSEQERSEQGTLEKWSAKDLIAHTVAWIEEMSRTLRAAASGEPYPTFDNLDEKNASFYAEFAAYSWPEVVAYAANARQHLAQGVQALSEEDLVDPAKSTDDKVLLWRGGVGNAYTHPLAHYAQFYLLQNKPDQAIQLQQGVIERLSALDDSPRGRGVAVYNLACFYSIAGQKDEALYNLRQAFQIYPDIREFSRQDPDLNPLHGEPDYEALYS